MAQTPPKKVWVSPELIVLVRSNPEEAVLFACKAGAVGGPASGFSICAASLPSCTGCSSEVGS
jgi:hypothetical protein